MFSGCSTAPVGQAPRSGIPMAHFPKMVVGDSWSVTANSRIHLSDIFNKRVVQVGKDGSFVVELKGEKGESYRSYYDNKYRLVKNIDMRTGKQTVIADPPARELDFPLYIGKNWSDHYYAPPVSTGTRRTRFHYRNDYRVVKYETVNTKAGPLKAFKIRRCKQLQASESYFAEYWYAPDLKSVIRSKGREASNTELLSYRLAVPDTTPPSILIASPNLQRGIAIVQHAKQTKIEGFVKDDSGVKWLKINQKKVELNEAGQFSYLASLSEGANPFQIQASDVHGNEAKKTIDIAYLVPKAAPPHKEQTLASLAKPACWVLSIGVSVYENKQLSLRYAANDAAAIANILKDQEGKLFSEVFVKTLVNEQCTRADIMGNLTSHLGKAGPDDVVFIFVAGHGVRHKQTGSYYFLTYNADAKSLIYEGLKWSDFEEAIKIMSKNVNKVVLALDTCHAGSMKTYLRGIDGGEDLALALKQASGLYILASSKAGEESIEREHFKLPIEKEGHGAFTYALLKGLSGEANFDRDSYVSVHELFKYVAKLVPRITEGQQHPYSRTAGTDMPIAAFRE